MKLKTKELTTCALFAALIAIGAFIKVDIPLPMYTMHFTFQWFFVLMAGFLLGAKLATVSVIVYLSIGLVGVPVFAAGGGPAYIFRPGFGFLLGFVLAAFVIGTITEKVGKNHKGMFLMASVAGLVTYYTIGAIYDAVNSSAFQKGGVARYEKLEEGTPVIAEQDEVNKIIENGGWRCSDCGKINQSYITTCMCGKSKE